MKIGHLPRVLSFAACLAWFGHASAVTLDFEEFDPGDIVSGVDGVTVNGVNPELDAGINAARVFNSAAPTGGDFDLGTPNNQCGGPGNGDDSEVGPDGAFENCTPLGNVLIIDDDLNGEPDDIDRTRINGAIFQFEFSTPVTMREIDVLDTDGNGPNPRIELFAGETLLATFDIPGDMPNNGRDTVDLGPTAGVTRMDVWIQGSGAIDNIDFDTPVGEPRIELKKEVSLTGGEPFFDANTPSAGPVGALGADATYRLTVTNIGDEVLVNATVTDETLGLDNVEVPGGPLAPGETRVIESGDAGFGALFFEDRCDKPGEKTNIARVDAQGQNSGTDVNDTDPAFIVCEEPQIELLKQVSLTGGEPFFDADTPDDAPTGALGADATYRLIVRNTGSEALVDLVINDATLGLVNVPVPGGALAAGDERTITSGDSGFEELFFEGRCDETGNKVNIATVDAEGENSGTPVSSDNPANVNCAGEPEIELFKQVSLDGGNTFADANTPDDAVTGAIGADATYRLIVRNIGNETLVDLVINDSTLGLSNVPVPGGALNPGDERTITSGDSGFEELFFPDRCDSTGNKSNIADVAAVGEDSGQSVSDTDPANVRCVGVPEIELLKQVSLTGDEPFFDADTPSDAVAGTLGADATYRLIVRNIGSETLVNLVVSDPTLGLSNVDVPGGPLAPNEERTIVSGDAGFAALVAEGRCDTPGNKSNMARVEAEGEDTGTATSDEDPANVVCEEPQIELLKQVSLTGEAPFFDADTPATAPFGVLGADATYRLIVRNIGSETLINAVINDETLGLVNVDVPGGPLAPNEERTIVSGDAGFAALVAEGRCDTPGNKSNIATVDAEGENSGTSVSSENPANVNCVEPKLELLKQVSLTGGDPFFDADTADDAPTGALGADATYRLIVRNTGSETLLNAVINDDTLGLVDVPVPGGPLDPGDEVVISTGNTGFGALFAEDRCDTPGNKPNIATVDAEGEDSGEVVSSDDPANVNCVGEPAIELLKQVSLTGDEPFVDADTPGDAPMGLLGADATYRLIVRNTGNETLINAVVSDATLGLVDVAVPGGPLAPGDERTIDAGTAGFGALFAEGRCDTPGNKSNTATVTAEGEGSGQAASDDDPANVNCESPVCTIAVDKTCVVAAPPAPGPFDCKQAKELTGLTMIWNGPSPVSISGGGVSLSGINAGDEVTFNVTSKDTELSVSGAANGTSTFHTSCSDQDMNGPEDCGKAQGNGKKDNGGLNLWVLEGITGQGGALDCTVAPPDTGPGIDECTATTTGVPSCASLKSSKQKLTSLTFRYTGGGCGASNNSQKSHKCEGSIDGSSPASVSGKDGGGATVELGGLVTLSEDEAKEANVSNGGGTEVNEIHTSCSQPLNPGDVYGSLTLVGLNGQTGGPADVTYNYQVTNTGDTEVTLSSVLDDQLGEVLDSAPDPLAPDDTVTFTATAALTETRTNIVTVTGNVSGTSSAECEAMDAVTVTVVPGRPVGGDGDDK